MMARFTRHLQDATLSFLTALKQVCLCLSRSCDCLRLLSRCACLRLLSRCACLRLLSRCACLRLLSRCASVFSSTRFNHDCGSHRQHASTLCAVYLREILPTEFGQHVQFAEVPPQALDACVRVIRLEKIYCNSISKLVLDFLHVLTCMSRAAHGRHAAAAGRGFVAHERRAHATAPRRCRDVH
jgi:hypothetical protein